GLAPTPWNERMFHLTATLWVAAVGDVFVAAPSIAWQIVPLPRPSDDSARETTTSKLEDELLRVAREQLSSRVRLSVEGRSIPLRRLAYECPGLEGVLSHREIARLAGAEAAIADPLRDPGGRWRQVLADWQTHGAELLAEVGVEAALPLVEDATRSPEST